VWIWNCWSSHLMWEGAQIQKVARKNDTCLHSPSPVTIVLLPGFVCLDSFLVCWLLQELWDELKERRSEEANYNQTKKGNWYRNWEKKEDSVITIPCTARFSSAIQILGSLSTHYVPNVKNHFVRMFSFLLRETSLTLYFFYYFFFSKTKCSLFKNPFTKLND
jgi:hypothetical protein